MADSKFNCVPSFLKDLTHMNEQMATGFFWIVCYPSSIIQSVCCHSPWGHREVIDSVEFGVKQRSSYLSFASYYLMTCEIYVTFLRPVSLVLKRDNNISHEIRYTKAISIELSTELTSFPAPKLPCLFCFCLNFYNQCHLSLPFYISKGRIFLIQPPTYLQVSPKRVHTLTADSLIDVSFLSDRLNFEQRKVILKCYWKFENTIEIQTQPL